MGQPGQMGVYFDSAGCRLLGTLFLAQRRGPVPTALLLHGVPGIEKNYDLAHTLRDVGWNALIFHYRGCWGSEGNYTLKGVVDDTRAALDYVCSGAHPEVDPDRVAAFGHSLGGWAAMLAAARDARIKAVVACAAVSDPGGVRIDAASARESFTPWLQGITPDEFERQWRELDRDFVPLDHVSELAPRPLLVLHGGHDELVPVDHAHALFEAAVDPRALDIHPDADHAFSWHRRWLQQRVIEFLVAAVPVTGVK